MSKHTPGPWAVNQQFGTRIESTNEHGWVNDGWIIAKLEGPDAVANARLIAAAPDMLATLELFANIFADYEIHHLTKGDAESIVKAERNREYKEIAKKVTAKARGEK